MEENKPKKTRRIDKEIVAAVLLAFILGIAIGYTVREGGEKPKIIIERCSDQA